MPHSRGYIFLVCPSRLIYGLNHISHALFFRLARYRFRPKQKQERGLESHMLRTSHICRYGFARGFLFSCLFVMFGFHFFALKLFKTNKHGNTATTNERWIRRSVLRSSRVHHVKLFNKPRMSKNLKASWSQHTRRQKRKKRRGAS